MEHTDLPDSVIGRPCVFAKATAAQVVRFARTVILNGTITTHANTESARNAHGRGVVSYLARYVRGGPISNSRIVSVNHDEVVFDVGREKRLLISLTPLEFIERFLQHVLPDGFIAARHWAK